METCINCGIALVLKPSAECPLHTSKQASDLRRNTRRTEKPERQYQFDTTMWLPSESYEKRIVDTVSTVFNIEMTRLLDQRGERNLEKRFARSLIIYIASVSLSPKQSLAVLGEKLSIRSKVAQNSAIKFFENRLRFDTPDVVKAKSVFEELGITFPGSH